MSVRGDKKRKKEKDRRASQKRRERRLLPHSAANPWLVRGLGVLGGLLLGAGVWGYFWAKSFALLEEKDRLRDLPAYLVAAGAVVMAVVIWLGTSSDPPMRVGDPGIAIEKGETRRMPWWAVKQITFDSGTLALVVSGKDEAGTDWVLKVALKSHPDAIAWIVKEAEERIPKRVDIPDSMLEKMPVAQGQAGTRIDLEPLQVVGRRCAVSGRSISYEPDARVCPRCERVYYKTNVPRKCKCGLVLASARTESASDEGASDEGAETDETEDPSRSSARTSTREPAEEEAET